PPSWKYNLGEKSWYWLLAFAGTAISVSGVFLIFPAVPENVQNLQLSQVVHVISAIALIAASLGHIYLGIWGVEGALDSMTLGYVDETWGMEHHRWWAEEELKKDHVVEGAPDAVLAAKNAEAS
ncbi:MAG TPA: cytochrome b/b6 domain-containing protein, partial [Magnetovibrio sp.]